MNRTDTIPATVRNRAANTAMRQQDLTAELALTIHELHTNYGLEWADIAYLLDLPEATVRRDFQFSSQPGATS